MKKDKFLVQIYRSAQGKKDYIKVEGYVKQEGNYWFGIHKWEGNKVWTITELSTGQKVREGDTIKSCEEKLPECAGIVESFLTGRYKELYVKAQKECEQAYLDIDKGKLEPDTELADTFFKL